MNKAEQIDTAGGSGRSTTSTDDMVIEFDGTVSPAEFQIALSGDGRTLTLRRRTAGDRFYANAPEIDENGNGHYKKTTVKYHDRTEVPAASKSVKIVISQ